jgi:hypothetical protein
MFRHTACARVRAIRLAAKDCRAVTYRTTVSNSRSPEVAPPVAVLLLTNEFMGEFDANNCFAAAHFDGLCNHRTHRDSSLSVPGSEG